MKTTRVALQAGLIFGTALVVGNLIVPGAEEVQALLSLWAQ